MPMALHILTSVSALSSEWSLSISLKVVFLGLHGYGTLPISSEVNKILNFLEKNSNFFGSMVL